ncbi:MAG: hypothetical protein CVV49_00300 [Spirochaetae bacterium HGW-Spirochaetae-5]|nr:MAG: hypothetical protein CVV49_00300 [Spirochaetae bacterium HGW-Spirochaetae-5]
MKNQININITKLILTAILSLSGSGLYSAQIGGVHFQDVYPSTSGNLNIRGYSILNYMMVIKAYAGALYLKPSVSSDQALSAAPRILELYYFHKISADDFRESTIEMIKKNTDSAGFGRIENQLNAFNAFYRDVVPGDRYRADYTPENGTTLYLNGRALGTIKSDEFSKAFFSIWIGKNPIDKKFRDRLLGR